MKPFSFYLFEILFFLTFFLILGVFIFVFVKGITQWSKNSASPRLTVPVRVVAKRTYISRHHGPNYHVSTSHNYYVTFQVESGDRMELLLPGREFGLIVEGDQGRLTFQGTRFLSFERSVSHETI